MTNIGNYAKDPAEVLRSNVLKGYAGLRFEQGVPLLERDLNLQSQLLASLQRSIIEHYIGNGSRFDDEAFLITACNPPGNNFQIAAGSALVGGIEVTGVDTDFDAQRQTDFPLTKIESGQPKRLDIVYLDVWLEEVPLNEIGQAIDINNNTDPGDVAQRTSMRVRPQFRVRVAEGKPMPAPVLGEGHAYYKLAEIARNSENIDSDEITDKRVKNLNLEHLVTTLDALQVDLALIKDVLKPSFASMGPKFDRSAAYGGRVVTLFGKNFHIGDVKVEFVRNDDNYAPLSIVGDVRPTTLQVQLDPAILPGSGVLKVTTGLGSATSPSFRVYGKVKLAAQPWSAGVKSGNSNLVLTGDFFDCPGLELEISKKNPPESWAPLVIQGTPTATSVTVKLPNPASQTNYKIRARNEASRALFSGDDQWTVSNPGVDLKVNHV